MTTNSEQAERLQRLAARKASQGRSVPTAKGLASQDGWSTAPDPAVSPLPCIAEASVPSGWSTFGAPDPSGPVDLSRAIGSADPLGDLRRAHVEARSPRATSARRRRMHAAGASRILAAGLSTSAMFVGVAALASSSTTSSNVKTSPIGDESSSTAAPVVIESDITVDEQGNEIPAPVAKQEPTATSLPPTTVDADPNTTTTASATILVPLSAEAGAVALVPPIDGTPTADQAPAAGGGASPDPRAGSATTAAKRPVTPAANTTQAGATASASVTQPAAAAAPTQPAAAAAPTPVATQAPAPAAATVAAPVATQAPAPTALTVAAPVATPPPTAAPTAPATPAPTAPPATAAPKPVPPPTTAKPACTGSTC